MIFAVSEDGVIGKDGQIPWHYPGDFKRFKELTVDSTVIMGRRTHESIGRPLPRRRNVVITRATFDGVDCYDSIEAALETTTGNVWFIGGRGIYEAAMEHCALIDVTHVPEVVGHDGDVVLAPQIDPSAWPRVTHAAHPYAPELRIQRYER